MATATSKPLTQGHARPHVTDVHAPLMEFRTFEDNAGDFYWTIVDGDGATLARSGGFASRDLATQAAKQIRDGVASARLGDGAAEAAK
ncbi:MAG: DUF1508 domain-containing protein [Solirubrobacteraceae bacterium]